MGRLPGAPLFRVMPEDLGPLDEAERGALLSFLQEHAPEMHEALLKLQRDDPASFDRQFQRAAPYLRRLQRIFQRNPELGESIVRHSQNLQKLRRFRQAWRESAEDLRTRQRIEELMQQLVAENVEIEAAALDDQIRELEFQRDARIKAEFDRLLAADADLAAEPAQVRDWVRRLQEHPPQTELEWLQDELWVVCAERMDVEVQAARRHLERMRDNLAAEIERRMDYLKRPPSASRPARDAEE